MLTFSTPLQFFIISLLSGIYSTSVFAAPSESWYQDVWCLGKGGEVEHRLDDGRRIDCLTQTHAIEVEFARKWPEAVGQSLDYSMLTGKQAGVVLVVRKKDELIHWQRLNNLIQHYQLPITTWRLGP